MKIETEYNLGDIVYRLNDPEQREFIVVGIFLRPECSIGYYITNSEGTERTAYSCEICSYKDIIKAESNK